MSERLTHLDDHGRAHMVDVGAKEVSERVCVARAEVRMAAATLARIAAGSLPKGDVLAVARLAGIQAAKRTSDWIPLAHLIPLDAVDLALEIDPAGGCVRVEATARAHARTGVEMEALVAVAAASLALYDMCKAVDRGITVDAVRLVEKRGGKSGHWLRPGEQGPPAPGGRPAASRAARRSRAKRRPQSPE
jgi:cyclic pyranopterin phosphate synthase